ncbi:MAG: ubiquitin-like protein Pup [Actinobacteria bacterium]|nr:ubiquitin-like protein Pup [Actinomycetota bacterium]
MAERLHKQRQTSDRTGEVSAEPGAATEQGEKLRAELDDLLDEIDDVLESNAEDFVKSYIQKGGE